MPYPPSDTSIAKGSPTSRDSENTMIVTRNIAINEAKILRIMKRCIYGPSNAMGADACNQGRLAQPPLVL